MKNKIKAVLGIMLFGSLYPFFRLIYGRTKVLSIEKTINKIINEKLSVTRFGDSEYRFLLDKGDRLQPKSELLKLNLIDVLKNRNSNLLICIVDYTRLYDKTLEVKYHHLRAYITLYTRIKKYFDNDYPYGDANLTRFYMNTTNVNLSKKYFEIIKKVWQNKDIVVFEGEFTRFGYGNDLFNNVKSTQRILCPSNQAFIVIDDILSFARTIEKDKLLLFALGATATICASVLSNEGYWVLDIGNLDVEYEWFKRGLKKRSAIENKQVYEALNNDMNLLSDEDYSSQIIARIGV